MRGKANDLAMDLYRDLRDKRLLVIVVALVVAIAAVPFLVGGGEPAPRSPSVAGTGDDAAELDSVVIAEPATLRDYRSRFDGAQGSNPFKQQLVPKPAPAEGGDDGNLPTEDSLATGDGAATDTGTPTTDPLDPVDPADPVEPVQPSDESDSEAKLITFTVDVRVRVPGKVRTVRDVVGGDLLPDKKNAIVQYVGSEFDEKSASFVVSPNAVATNGDGRCSPDRRNCGFLRLGVGDSQELRDTISGDLVEIELLDIDRVEETVDPDELGNGTGDAPTPSMAVVPSDG